MAHISNLLPIENLLVIFRRDSGLNGTKFYTRLDFKEHIYNFSSLLLWIEYF